MAFNPAEKRDAQGRWTKGETKALTWWLSDNTWDDVTEAAPEAAEARANLASALAKMEPYAKPVYRGVSPYASGGHRFATLKKGDIVHWREHKSGTSSRSLAEWKFGTDTYVVKDAPGRVFNYDALPGGAADPFEDEREVVLPPGDYEVTGLGSSAKKQAASVTLTYRGPLSRTDSWVTRKKDRGLDLAFNPAEPRDAEGEWTTLYHGTSKARAALALSKGLHPGAHLTSNPAAARQYARYASGGTAWTKDKRKQGVVLKVRVRSGETTAGDYGRDSFVSDHQVTSAPLEPDRLRADIDLAFNPAEPRDAAGKWTKDETRAWLERHPVDAKNIVSMWDQGTPGEHQAGEVWYPNAHRVAEALGKRYGVSTKTAAGLLATYSPQTAWGQDVRDASESLREHRPLGGPGERIWWHRDPSTPNTVEEREGIMAPGVSRARALRILAGQNPDEVFAGGRLKSGRLKPNSLKVRAFAELIANGVNDPSHPKVVIDRHAAGVARGVRMTEDDYGVAGPSSSTKKFEEYAAAYREAARQISKKVGHEVPPEAVQAATWLTRQRLNGAMVSQVGRTRHSLGNRDSAMLDAYAQQYLPEATTFLPKVGYGDLSHEEPTIDLASPDAIRRPRPTVFVGTQRKVDEDTTVRQIATLLRTGYRFKRLPTDFDWEVQGLVRLLEPWDIREEAVRMALGLTHTEGGYARGTQHSPNARLDGATLDTQVRDVRDHDVYFRAAYLANAALRMQRTLDEGGTQRDALRREQPYYRLHEEARKGRLKAVSQVQTAAKVFGAKDETGTLVGWYLNPLLKNEAECIAANGHNFYAEHGTVIGLPGSVHNRCGCYAGPPWEGASLVNDVMRNVTALHPVGSTAKFQLRKRKGA